jgi:pimeloyl-ACP methyl ester carboxylesterase
MVTATSCGGSRPPKATASRPAGPSALAWASCPRSADLKGLQCATLTVPLDYAAPARGTIGIYLDRHVATGTPIGSLLTNPGGPGVSGVDYLPSLLPALGASILARFDVVGFDPRGVGRSDPVTCGTTTQLDATFNVNPAPTTAAGLAALVAADRTFDAGCDARSSRLLPFVGTVDAARDMDRIRAAVGDPRLTYLGFSYGTLLGATYARLFPTHIRAMVLDGALDPALDPVAVEQTQAAALDGELDAFFASCRAGRCGWDPGGDPTAAFDALLRQVGTRAVSVPVAGGDQVVGEAAMLYGTAQALYSTALWPTLGRALTGLEDGNGRIMLALYDYYFGRSPVGYDNEIEAETAIDCMDAPAPTVPQLAADAAATVRAAPVFGLLDLYGGIPCSLWPVAPTGRPAPIRAVGSPPIVVVGSTGDPITPYVWAQALAHQLAHGVLLTRTGLGHTGYTSSSCIQAAVNRYLLTRTPPVAGTTCSSN